MGLSQVLTEELGELMDDGFDLADTPFDPSELANLFPEEAVEDTEEPEDQEAPELASHRRGR